MGISIHAPHEGERPGTCWSRPGGYTISIHAPHEGERPDTVGAADSRQNFNPRSPRGGATYIANYLDKLMLISIHAPHEGERRAASMLLIIFDWLISIHAPHEGERRGLRALRSRLQQISIHAPHEGERLPMRIKSVSPGAFQSTLPTRGSDGKMRHKARRIIISIHAPHEGERRAECHEYDRYAVRISIHAPHEGERLKSQRTCLTAEYFNPRSPRGGATRAFIASCSTERRISIHAPHEGERPI